MSLQIMSPSELRDTINEIYYRNCIQHNTPNKIEAVLFEIDNIRKQYEKQEEYRLCQICSELKAELELERDVRVSNDMGDALIELLT